MRKGFTLIELLVVIAIIAILAAILFPVFARARAKAMQASCLSDVKQLALACNSYATDYDGRYMAGGMWHGYFGDWTSNSPPNNIDMWHQLDPYVRNSQIWLCPSLSPYEAQTAFTPGYNNGVTHLMFGYMWNHWSNGRYWSNDGWFGVSVGKVTRSATCVMVGDGFGILYGDVVSPYNCNWANLDLGLTADTPYWPSNLWDGIWGIGPPPPCQGWEARHSGLCNFAFVDGHAKAMSLDVLATTPGPPIHYGYNDWLNAIDEPY